MRADRLDALAQELAALPGGERPAYIAALPDAEERYEVQMRATGYCLFPVKAASFRAVWERSRDPRTVAGLSAMTDAEVEQLARGLRAALTIKASTLDELWAGVRTRGAS